ncbi:MAG TPA: hypothetical protein H9823_03020 [Candidatus Rubneribacter avistercoris]|nr:hypothetical protein [Candidatus Rubneribacter avistercoris]
MLDSYDTVMSSKTPDILPPERADESRAGTALFTKRPASDATKRKAAARSDLLLISAEDLFKDL